MHTHARKSRSKKTPARPGPPPFLPLAVVMAASCAWSVSVARQEPPPAEAPKAGQSSEGAPGPETDGSQVAPELQSSYVVRVYKVRPTKLWKGLLESLTAEGCPPEETDEERRTVKTSFVDFKQDDYPLQVGEAPLPLGGTYHIVQMIKVKQGKFSLEGVVTPTEQGTELRVRARILVMGLDRVKRVRVLVDRRSTGVIESDFIHKLEARLSLEHL